jgi:hypothetical protein
MYDFAQRTYAEGFNSPDKPIPFGTPRDFVAVFLRGQAAGKRAREREGSHKGSDKTGRDAGVVTSPLSNRADTATAR